MMPKADVIELDISVDAALKYIISMGVVPPDSKNPAEYADLKPRICRGAMRRTSNTNQNLIPFQTYAH